MQFQSDILGVPVVTPQVTKTTALGAAMLAGRVVGLWDDNRLKIVWQRKREFRPTMPGENRERLLQQWRRAIERARKWEEEQRTGKRRKLRLFPDAVPARAGTDCFVGDSVRTNVGNGNRFRMRFQQKQERLLWWRRRAEMERRIVYG